MPETIEYDHNVHTSNSEDQKLHVVFYMNFVENEGKTKSEGHKMFDDTPFLKIFTPGDRSNIIDRPVRESDKLRFRQKWVQFTQNQEQRASGTPIVEWPIVTRGQAEELKYLGFDTVEQIAGANDNVNYMGLQELKMKAKVYLETAKGNMAPIEQMSQELAEYKANNKVQTDAIELLKSQVAELTQKIIKSK